MVPLRPIQGFPEVTDRPRPPANWLEFNSGESLSAFNPQATVTKVYTKEYPGVLTLRAPLLTRFTQESQLVGYTRRNFLTKVA